MKRLSLLVLFNILYLWMVAQNADSIWVVNNYTKTERQITMRDGVRLFTSIYIPKDESENHPILMERTPYSCAP